MRKYYLDNIRWATVLVVVLYHVLYMYNAEGILGGLGSITGLKTQWYDLFLYIVYPWLMPVLFLVSGMCARFSLDRRTDRKFLRDRTVRLLVPSTVGLFVFHFLQGYVNLALSDALTQFSGTPVFVRYLILALSGIGPLWYIQLLWVFSVGLVLIRKLEKDRLWSVCEKMTAPVLTLLVLPVWATAQVLNTPVVVVYRFGLYGLVFLLGYFVFSHDAVIERVKAWLVPFALTAAVLGIAFCVSTFRENYADAPVNRSPLFVGFSWFACLAILGGAARFADRSTALTRWLGARSFGLYVFHYLGISAVALFLAKPGLLPALAVYPLSLLAGFGGGYLLNALFSRLPFLRWALLGIRKPKEDPHVP